MTKVAIWCLSSEAGAILSSSGGAQTDIPNSSLILLGAAILVKFWIKESQNNHKNLVENQFASLLAQDSTQAKSDSPSTGRSTAPPSRSPQIRAKSSQSSSKSKIPLPKTFYLKPQIRETQVELTPQKLSLKRTKPMKTSPTSTSPP